MGKINDFFIKWPFFKGLVAYSILWPTADLLHQKWEGKPKLDLLQAARYGAVGVTFVLPAFYTWIKTINRLLPGTNLQACVKKVICEQVFYWPIAITVFFAGVNFWDGDSFDHFVAELKQKYVKTHMTGLCFWPFVAPIINYSNLVKDHNRTPIAATASFIWASFLSYMKELEVKKK